jgi:hypothetical protein
MLTRGTKEDHDSEVWLDSPYNTPLLPIIKGSNGLWIATTNVMKPKPGNIRLDYLFLNIISAFTIRYLLHSANGG